MLTADAPEPLFSADTWSWHELTRIHPLVDKKSACGSRELLTTTDHATNEKGDSALLQPDGWRCEEGTGMVQIHAFQNACRYGSIILGMRHNDYETSLHLAGPEEIRVGRGKRMLASIENQVGKNWD